MNDWKLFKEIQRERRLEKEASRIIAGGEYKQAKGIAKAAGLILKRHSDQHYSLRDGKRGWLQNIYPGNRRLYYDKHKPKPPYVKLRYNWGLIDVVRAMAEAVEREGLRDPLSQEFRDIVG